MRRDSLYDWRWGRPEPTYIKGLRMNEPEAVGFWNESDALLKEPKRHVGLEKDNRPLLAAILPEEVFAFGDRDG